MPKYLSHYLTLDILKYIVRPSYKLDNFINKKNLDNGLIANPNGIELAFALFNKFEIHDICSNPNLIKIIKKKIETHTNKWDFSFSLSKNPNAKYILNKKKDLIDYEELAENPSKWALKKYFEYILINKDKIRFPEIIWKNPYVFDFLTIKDNIGTYKNYSLEIDFEWLQTNPHPKALELLLENNIKLNNAFLLENTNENALKFINHKKLLKSIFDDVDGLTDGLREFVCFNLTLYNFVKTTYDLDFIDWRNLEKNSSIFNKDNSKTFENIKKIDNIIYKII